MPSGDVTQVAQAQQTVDTLEGLPIGGDAGPRDGQQEGESIPITDDYQQADAETRGTQSDSTASTDEGVGTSDAGDVVDDMAEQYGTPTFTTPTTDSVPATTTTVGTPDTPTTPAGTTLATPTTTTTPTTTATPTTPATQVSSGAGAPTEQVAPAEPKEKYGVYLLFESRSAIWVGAESSLKGRARGSFSYGGMCRDAKKCPIDYGIKLGPFDTQPEAVDAFCNDLEKGPWYSLGVWRVKMKWREKSYAGSRVPGCKNRPKK